MQYAVWIALAVVFIAIAPSLYKSATGKSSSDAGSDPGRSDGDGGTGKDDGDD